MAASSGSCFDASAPKSTRFRFAPFGLRLMVQALVILAMSTGALAGQDYYHVLGIPRSANPNQIKRAYRKMSMKWHPDKNQGNKEQAQKKFVEISSAYEVLSDPKKKNKYDKFGEAGLKEGEPAHRPNTFPDGDKFKVFEQFFAKGGGPFAAGGADTFFTMDGGGAEFSDMGGRGGGLRGRSSGVSLKGLSHVEDLSEKLFHAKFEGPASERKSLVVVFYTAGCLECKDLRKAFEEFGDKFAAAGLAEVASVNCARQTSLCQEEAQGASLPVVNYYGAGSDGRRAKRHPTGTISFKSLSMWYPRVMTDFCKILTDLGEVRKWLASNDKVPHAIFFSDRKSTPLLPKMLSIEFNKRAAIGIILAGADAEVAARFNVKSRPSLVHVLDEDSFESDHFDKSFNKYEMTSFLARAIGRHRQLSESALRELTPSRFRNGDCSPTDSSFCVLLLRPKAGASGALTRDSLRQLAHRIAKYPVKVFIVRDASFSDSFGQAPGTVVLYRPKRKRFKVFFGDAGNADDLRAFVDGAVDGGSPLPEAVNESPVMKD